MSDRNTLIYEYPSEYGETYQVRPFIDMYRDNENLYVGLEYLNKENGEWEPFGHVTVNTIPLAYLEGTVDINNNGLKLLDFLEENGFGKRTPWVTRSGHCVYPIFRFSEEKISEIDPKIFQAYAKTFGKDKKPLNTLISDAQKKTEPAVGNPGSVPEKASGTKERG